MPSGLSIELVTAAVSDPGRDPNKQVNEDAFRLVKRDEGLLVVVCDGMGGHTSGRLASAAAVCQIEQGFQGAGALVEPRQRLGALIAQANLEVYALGGQAPPDERPGTTCVAAWLEPQGLYVAHVGDSRAYRHRNGSLYPLTRDHTLVEDWVAAGQLAREQVKGHPDAHRLTRALGIGPHVEIELRPSEDVRVGDRLLFCTDGLTDLVSDEELARELGSKAPLSDIASRLVTLANDRGGHDNITVVLVEVPSLHPSPLAGTTLDRVVTETGIANATEMVRPSPGLAKTVLLETQERATVVMPRATSTQPLATVEAPPLPGKPAAPWGTPPRASVAPELHRSHRQAQRRLGLVIAVALGLTLLGLLLRVLRHRAG